MSHHRVEKKHRVEFNQHAWISVGDFSLEIASYRIYRELASALRFLSIVKLSELCTDSKETKMHAKQMAEIAAWAAFNSVALIQRSTSLTVETCNDYWTQSKCRQNRWMTALKMFEQDVRNASGNHDPWPAIEIVVQEIFVSEMLTRVWSAAMVAHDIRFAASELTGIAHSIHIGHLEAKNRAMRLLLENESVGSEMFEQLNSLRRKVERWTDLLLGQLPDIEASQKFAFQANRVKDFAEESVEANHREYSARQVLYSAALGEDLNGVCNRYAANPSINRKIVGGLLSCFDSDRFDSLGMPKSVRLMWMEKSTDETQLLINSLDALDSEFMSETIGKTGQR